jgi:hypothetical protein
MAVGKNSTAKNGTAKNVMLRNKTTKIKTKYNKISKKSQHTKNSDNLKYGSKLNY